MTMQRTRMRIWRRDNREKVSMLYYCYATNASAFRAPHPLPDECNGGPENSTEECDSQADG